MKSRLIYLGSTLLIIVLSMAFLQIDKNSSYHRVHQHRQSQWQDDQNEKDGEQQTHIPIVRINTGGQKVPGTPIVDENGEWIAFETASDRKTTIVASFSVIDHENGLNHLTDEPTLTSLANIRYRGNSSRYFDKKSYSIHLINDDGTDNNQEIMGMSAHNEWVLNGPFLDRSLLRNYVAYNITGEIMDYAPNVRYCELYVDGVYQGLYLCIEAISKGIGRINLKKPEKNSSVTGYIVRYDREGKGDHELNDFVYYTYRNGISSLDVKYPGINQITEERMNYINRDISKIEKIIYSYDFLNRKSNYTNYIDLNEFAEYFIINEFFRNVDAGKYSTYYYKDVRGKLKPCVWDFNNTADNYMDYPNQEDGFSLIAEPFFDALIKDKLFVTAVVNRYRQLRKGVLSEEYLLNYIDETNTWLGEVVTRNYEVWGYVFDLKNYNEINYLTPVERNVRSQKEAVEQLKNFLVARGKWLDEYIETLYQYCHVSKNANYLLR